MQKEGWNQNKELDRISNTMKISTDKFDSMSLWCSLKGANMSIVSNHTKQNKKNDY